MKRYFLFFSVAIVTHCNSQDQLYKEGNIFPNYLLRPVINFAKGEIDIHKISNKIIILNFWGTWCAPCLPEMETLTKLQDRYSASIQVIAVSNDNTQRLKNYLAKRPTKILLASDTANFLYKSVGFSYVGQSIIIGKDKRIVALVHSDSINERMVQRLMDNKAIKSSAEFIFAGSANDDKDRFGVDSLTEENVCLRSYMPDMSTMSQSYPGRLRGRRLTYFNTCSEVLYKDAFDISSQSQVIYEVDKKLVCDFSDKTKLLCFDFLVREAQKDSFKIIMQKTLNAMLPFKARVDQKELPVLVLKRNSVDLGIQSSSATDSTYWFSGRGFNGKGVHISTFIGYLTNALGMPVLDETGLTGKYDIKTENAFSSKEEVLKAIEKIGFEVEESRKQMPILIIYQ